MNNYSLSKSKFLAGWQCPLRLWYDIRMPELAPKTPRSLQAIFDVGHEVGLIAHRRYPGGRLIAEEYDQHSQAIESTRAAMADKNVPAIFEAAFEYDGIRVRADVLERNGSGWNLIEVKSSTSVKEVNVYDVALQYYVLKGSGINVKSLAVGHVNNQYIFDGVQIDPKGFLTLNDVTQDTISLQGEVASLLSSLRLILSDDTPPKAEPPYRCSDPYECLYYDHCTRDKDEYWVFNLPRLGAKKLKELEGRGVTNVRELPDDYKLSDLQRRVVDALVNGKEYLSSELRRALDGVQYPIHFLDFETFAPAIPKYKGTRPYQALPFQWSCHILDKTGKLSHKEYLCVEDKDPRTEFAETLINAIGKGSICMYAGYEKRIISALANELPQYRVALEAMVPRLWDLRDTIRDNYYHRDFGGSFSLKAILPAMIEDMSYGDLDIHEGTQASMEYERMICKSTPQTDKNNIKTALLEYCKQDTLAMVRIREELLKKA